MMSSRVQPQKPIRTEAKKKTGSASSPRNVAQIQPELPITEAEIDLMLHWTADLLVDVIGGEEDNSRNIARKGRARNA